MDEIRSFNLISQFIPLFGGLLYLREIGCMSRKAENVALASGKTGDAAIKFEECVCTPSWHLKYNAPPKGILDRCEGSYIKMWGYAFNAR